MQLEEKFDADEVLRDLDSYDEEEIDEEIVELNFDSHQKINFDILDEEDICDLSNF